MIEITRGNIVRFYDFQFRDINKAPTVPDSATLRIRYLKCGCEKFDYVEMTEDGGLWSAEWEGAEADPGIIYWHIKADGGPAEDGQFRLRANPANPREE